MSAIDHALEEIIPEDLLLEPPETESSVVHTKVPDDVPLAGNLVVSHPGFRGPKPGREHKHQVCWDQVSHI
jgi:hypothetical protein